MEGPDADVAWANAFMCLYKQLHSLVIQTSISMHINNGCSGIRIPQYCRYIASIVKPVEVFKDAIAKELNLNLRISNIYT